ncbi:MAG TPA: heme-degrading domain-containing protein [Tabrizicola sp.]|nr:heme-degrading domain-containing protein [Tabrizicola sp.]
MTREELEAEGHELVLDGFDEAIAFRLGEILIGLSAGPRLPVVIDIRTANRTLFHVALPGSTPLNDLWAQRKSNVALVFHEASLAVGTRNRAKGQTLADQGLSEATHADHGGAVPIRVRGTGVVAVATVSGLPQVDDHKLVVQGIRALIAERLQGKP